MQPGGLVRFKHRVPRRPEGRRGGEAGLGSVGGFFSSKLVRWNGVEGEKRFSRERRKSAVSLSDNPSRAEILFSSASSTVSNPLVFKSTRLESV